MNKSVWALLILCLLLAMGARAQPMPVAAFTTVYACKLHAGKTIDDAWEVLDAWVKVVPLQPQGSSFLWTRFRTGSEYDYIWGINSASLNHIANGYAAYFAAPGAAELGKRFTELSRCDTAIVESKEIRAGVVGNTADRNPDAIVEVWSCTLNDGTTRADLNAMYERWNALLDQNPSEAARTFSAWLWTPFRGLGPEVDYFFVGTYPDLKTWGQGETDYYAFDRMQPEHDWMDKNTRCGNGLWTGYWLVAPE